MRTADVVAMDRDGNRLLSSGNSGGNSCLDANTRVTTVEELMMTVLWMYQRKREVDLQRVVICTKIEGSKHKNLL